MAIDGKIFLRERQLLPLGHADLQRNEVKPRNHFCDRMFDLQTRVHFHEIERTVGIEQKLNRPCPRIANRLGGGHGGGAHFGANICGKPRRRRFFNHLLMAPLDGTVTFEQINRIARVIGKNLNFDMARPRQVFFDEHMFIAESGQRLALRPRKGFAELRRVFNHAHALAPATGGCLDKQRVADFIRLRRQKLFILLVAVIAGHQGHARFFHQSLRFGFAAHGADSRHGRAYKDEASFGDRFGEIFVFGQKPVSGVNGIRPRLFGGIDDFGDIQITFACSRRAYQHGFVRHIGVQRGAVGFGINGNGGNPHLAAGAHDAAGDFSTVGDKNFSNCHAAGPFDVSTQRL